MAGRTAPPPQPGTKWPQITPFANFPSPTSISKIIQHSRTDLLVAMQHPPELRRVDTRARATKEDPRNHSAWQTLHHFGEGAKACHGMTRLDRWRYAIITSEDEMETLAKPYRTEMTLRKGRSKIWIVDLKRWGTGDGWVEVRKLVDAPYARCLRGITTLPLPPPAPPFSALFPRELDRLPHILVTDATQGRIYILDSNTGRGAVWFAHQSMEPPLAHAKPGFYRPALGVTALVYFQGLVFYLNTSAGTIHCLGIRSSNFSPWEPVPSTLIPLPLKHRSLLGATVLPPCTDFLIRRKYGPEILLASPTAGIVRAHWHYRWMGKIGGRWYFHTMRRKLPSTSRSSMTTISVDDYATGPMFGGRPMIIGYTKVWIGTADKSQKRQKRDDEKEKGKKKKGSTGARVISVENTFHGIL